jgi:hypothetical protein
MTKIVTLNPEIEAKIGDNLPLLLHQDFGDGTTHDGRKISLSLALGNNGTVIIGIENSPKQMHIPLGDLLLSGVSALLKEIDGEPKELRL